MKIFFEKDSKTGYMRGIAVVAVSVVSLVLGLVWFYRLQFPQGSAGKSASKAVQARQWEINC